MNVKLILRLSDMEMIVADYKAGLIDMKEAVKKIKEIATQMELIENGQEELELDKGSC